jgi:hypothetical protein
MNCTRATRHTSASVPIVPTFNRYFSVPKVSNELVARVRARGGERIKEKGYKKPKAVIEN